MKLVYLLSYYSENWHKENKIIASVNAGLKKIDRLLH